MIDRDLLDELKEEVDEAWAENVRVLPLLAGQPDPDRSPEAVVAPLVTRKREESVVGYPGRSHSRLRVSAGGGELRINRTAYPNLLIRQGDKCVALDRAGEPVFEVSHVDDRDVLRLICALEDAS